VEVPRGHQNEIAGRLEEFSIESKVNAQARPPYAGGTGFVILFRMEYRKRYSNAEQEMVIGLYRESGKPLKEFCEGEGLEVGRVERWLKHREGRKANEVKFVEVEQEAALAASMPATLV